MSGIFIIRITSIIHWSVAIFTFHFCDRVLQRDVITSFHCVSQKKFLTTLAQLRSYTFFIQYFYTIVLSVKNHLIKINTAVSIQSKKLNNLHWQRCAEACNEWRSPSSRFSARATQLQRNIAMVASHWRHFVQFDRLGNQTSDLLHRLLCA